MCSQVARIRHGGYWLKGEIGEDRREMNVRFPWEAVRSGVWGKPDCPPSHSASPGGVLGSLATPVGPLAGAASTAVPLGGRRVGRGPARGRGEGVLGSVGSEGLGEVWARKSRQRLDRGAQRGVEVGSRPRGQQEPSVGRRQVTALTMRRSARAPPWGTQDGTFVEVWGAGGGSHGDLSAEGSLPWTPGRVGLAGASFSVQSWRLCSQRGGHFRGPLGG